MRRISRLSDLILRSRFCGVSKDECPGVAAGHSWFETALTRLLTMRINGLYALLR
jgi:hypothetical protein